MIFLAILRPFITEIACDLIAERNEIFVQISNTLFPQLAIAEKNREVLKIIRFMKKKKDPPPSENCQQQIQANQPCFYPPDSLFFFSFTLRSALYKSCSGLGVGFTRGKGLR